MESFQLNHILEAEKLNMKVRLSIFTITGVCAGLPALVWSVSDIIHHRKNGHRISIFILLLLLTDVAELLLSPYILTKLLDKMALCKDSNCWTFVSLWSSSRVSGFLLNQLVALEGISVKYPLYASVFSSTIFVIFFSIVCLCVIIGFMFLHHIYIVLMVFIASMIPWIISCRASCSADCQSHSSRKTDRHVLIVFIFTLLVIYLYLVVLCFFFIFIPLFHEFLLYWLDCFVLLSLRLISDPLLCVLVCRQNLSLQTPQKP